MEIRWCYIGISLAYCLTVAFAIPNSLVDQIKATEMRDNKVKRSQPDLNLESQNRPISYFLKPTAIKRGAAINFKNPTSEQQAQMNDWEQQSFNERQFPQTNPSLTKLYNTDNGFDDKTIAEYEKGYRYGTNKDKIDEALENAVLKSELYGDQNGFNPYRYYGAESEAKKRRKRQETKPNRFENRMKRDVNDLTPEEILTILTLYENQHPEWAPENLINEASNDDDDTWLDAPVYPHASSMSHNTDLGPAYYLKEKRNRWGSFGDRNKRFMVAKKRNDPTREIRYLNGPNKNDFYTLSQLLSSQREPNVPLYRRLVL